MEVANTPKYLPKRDPYTQCRHGFTFKGCPTCWDPPKRKPDDMPTRITCEAYQEFRKFMWEAEREGEKR